MAKRSLLSRCPSYITWNGKKTIFFARRNSVTVQLRIQVFFGYVEVIYPKERSPEVADFPETPCIRYSSTYFLKFMLVRELSFQFKKE